MAHIALPDGLPGITSAFAFRPETAQPMRELAEILLRGPGTLTSGEREMIATFVSARNDCYFCQSSHRAAAAHHLDGNYQLVDAVRADYASAPVTSKLKALLAIADKVRQSGQAVTAEDVARARAGRHGFGTTRYGADCRGLLHVQPLCRRAGGVHAEGRADVRPNGRAHGEGGIP